MSQRWRRAPKVGSPRSSWRRSRCRGETTSPASSLASPGTTATSSTTWWKRSCSVSPTRSAASCCRPRSWTGSAPRCATPSPARTSGKAMLEALERGNLFLVPLDDRRRWYRYHHLFADVLRARLLDEQPDHVPDLHRRASAWYEQNGEPSEAIRHALAAEDFPRAADLVELAVPSTAPESTGGHAAGAGSRSSPTSWSTQTGAERGVCRGIAGHRRARGRRGAPADAERWLDQTAERSERRSRRPKWSSWTKRIPPSPGCDRHVPRRPCPGCWATWPAP